MGCIYCGEDQALLDSMMEKLCDLPASTVYLFKDQKYYGRCVVAFRLYHAQELFELKSQDLSDYMKDVARTAKAVMTVSGADKLNYAIYGDKMPHVHVHIVPKHENGEDWGQPFQMSGEKVYLSEDKQKQLRENLLKALNMD